MNLLEKFSVAALILLFFTIVVIFFTSSKSSSSYQNIEEKILNSKFSEAKIYLENGRKFKEKGDIIEASDEYYKAVKLHSEYMDATSKDFLGDELKEVIKFSIVKLNQKLQTNPQNKNILARLKILYKMERRFGQGCE